VAKRLTKEQKAERINTIIYLRDEGKTRKEIAEHLNISFGSLKNLIRSNNISFSIKLNKQCKHCNRMYTTKNKLKEYCSSSCFDKGYNKTKRSRRERKCIQCGEVFSPKSEKTIYCSENCREESRECTRIEKELQLESQRKLKAINRLIKALNKKNSKVKECKYCGEKYFRIKYISGNSYCSDECRKQGLKELRKKYPKSKRTSKDRRWTLNGKADYSINIDKLYERDEGCCHICGERTNLNDYVVTTEGYFIAGNDYPSIDHVIPIAKGGLHQWDNVKLAHRICNSIKKDKLSWNNSPPF